MKQLIVLMAVLPMMLLFVMQFAYEQQRNDRIGKFQEIVYSSKEQARQDGCFTEENIANLKKESGRVFGVAEDEIVFEGTTVPKFRVNKFDERELIHYRIGTPVRNMMAGAGLLGISDDQNRMYYVIESWAASEKLAE